MKKMVALVCVLALMLTSFSVFATENDVMLIADEVVADEVASDAEATAPEAAEEVKEETTEEVVAEEKAEDILLIAPAPVSVPSDYAKEEVAKAAEAGLLAGFENLDYQKDITRAEFAKLIVNCVTPVLGLGAEEIVGETASPFSDVDDISVTTAALLGIVNGVGDKMFAPEQAITRQEIAAMMHRGVNSTSVLLDKTYLQAEAADLAAFADGEAVAEWAKISVSVLAGNDIMKGVSETELAPLANTTVEQAILLAIRIFDLMK